MYCRKCGAQLEPGARFCSECGAPVIPGDVRAMTPAQKKRRTAMIAAISAAAVVILAVILAVCFAGRDKDGDAGKIAADAAQDTVQKTQEVELPAEPVTALDRIRLIDLALAGGAEETAASSAPYTVDSDLSNVTNLDQFYFTDEEKQLLSKNLFVVSQGWGDEFFERYEYNRYDMRPSFVTVDSLMHTYHLYFSFLLNKTEKNYLADRLSALSRAMLETSMAQYDALAGTQWEKAAARNVAFFSVACALQDENFQAPEYAAAAVSGECNAIMDADRIGTSAVSGEKLDYSQFTPRGYYEGDPVLEAYFRAMMWYGQINFSQKNDSLNRSALLMTLAMEDGNIEVWQQIYTVTAFFAGISDDLGYYDYLPAIEAAYGKLPETGELPGNDGAYQTFAAVIAQMAPPAINSLPIYETEQGDVGELVKGFRFMGQRFTVDAAIMQQLVFRNVLEDSEGELRYLPDTLDVMAALGSDVALDILAEQGATDYQNYSGNMQTLRETVNQTTEEFWSSSLYSSWLYTLRPLLSPKGEGYPSFMRSTEWLKKDLETFAGSFTELKHDTVLYSKQMMAEMGGGPIEADDRGYVEPEVQVYQRFAALARQTSEGLQKYGLIGAEDVENLSRLESLASQLEIISRKELADETLSDDEYELIRGYGGTLEHFWAEAVRDKSQSEWLDPKEIPAPLVTDIATDPNGTILQIATGRPATIYVIVPVDGTLRIACGTVYDFYQFESPMGARMTDSVWRQTIGVWQRSDGIFSEDYPPKPAWTSSYRAEK